jgi:hypothetical protein
LIQSLPKLKTKKMSQILWPLVLVVSCQLVSNIQTSTGLKQH